MKNDFGKIYGESRHGKRTKRRKTNLILNSLIAIVLLLIIFVSAAIFLGGNDDAQSQNNKVTEKNKDAESKSAKKDKEKKKEKEKSKTAAQKSDSKSGDQSLKEKEDENEKNEEETEESKPVVTEGGSDPNVKQTIENPGWKPVGTTQTGEHTAVYDQSSVDWKEMEDAIASAIGIDRSNMTVWFLGNNGPNSSVGTVSEKGSDQTFRVYIDWVDGQGWKPVKVEELIQNDKR